MQPKRRIVLLSVFVAVLLAVCGGAGFVWWRYERLESWVAADSGTLAPYENELFPNGGVITAADQCLVEWASNDRVIIRLTRSEYRSAPLGGERWVKLHLVTGQPGNDKLQTPIKLLAKLKENESGWMVREVSELALP